MFRVAIDGGEERAESGRSSRIRPRGAGSSAAILRLRSTLTDSRSLLLVSNSSQAPRFGITLAEKSVRPLVGSSAAAVITRLASARAG